LLAIGSTSSAQPRQTAESMAKTATDRMKELVKLDDKQYEGIYALYLKEARRFLSGRGNKKSGDPIMSGDPVKSVIPLCG
jgi:hypothetical protein